MLALGTAMPVFRLPSMTGEAARTPDLFLFDARGVLVYRGLFDDSRPRSPLPVTGADLRAAAAAVLAGNPVPAT